jgi:hypothetical protein
MMTNKEILELLVWRDSNEARFERFSPLLGLNAEIQILTATEHRIAERSFRIVNDFLGLRPAQLEAIKKFLWDDCKLCCAMTSYGFDIADDQDETETNHREFRVHGPDDVLKASTLKYLLIIEDDQESYRSNFARLTFDNEWNSSLTTVVMKDGSIVGCGDSGLHIGQFE